MRPCGCSDRWGKKEPVSLSARQALTQLKTHVTCAMREGASFSFLLESARYQLHALQESMQANGVGEDGTGLTEVTTCEEMMRCVELIIACDADGPVEASDIRIQLGPAKVRVVAQADVITRIALLCYGDYTALATPRRRLFSRYPPPSSNPTVLERRQGE